MDLITMQCVAQNIFVRLLISIQPRIFEIYRRVRKGRKGTQRNRHTMGAPAAAVHKSIGFFSVLLSVSVGRFYLPWKSAARFSKESCCAFLFRIAFPRYARDKETG